MIRTRNLRKYFGSNHVLRGIDLTIEDGEVLVKFRGNILIKLYFYTKSA